MLSIKVAVVRVTLLGPVINHTDDTISAGMQLTLANFNIDRFGVGIKVSKIISFRKKLIRLLWLVLHRHPFYVFQDYCNNLYDIFHM